jgi:hypothetical protein
MMNSHGFGASLMESDDAKVSTFLEVDVFKFGVAHVYGVIVELPCFVDMVPDSAGDGVRSPRLAIALMSPGVVGF